MPGTSFLCPLCLPWIELLEPATMPIVSRLIRFGPFEADLMSGELRKKGVRVAIQAQPFEILAALLERPGALITREELRVRIWPNEVFVDFDHGLNKAISKLREALGDDGSKPKFVETLPRRGYRFIAPASAQSMEAAGSVVVARLLHEGKTISLSAGVHLIGRDESSAVCLASTTVSRRHARLTLAANAASIEDLHSKNGTRVKGRPIRGVTPLQDGDQIEVGSIAFTFLLSQGKSTETAP